MFKRSTKKIGSETAQGSREKRAYVIGDVHGRLDLLNDLLQLIEEDNDRRENKETIIVFLGDLIDRGPDSRGVIDLLSTAPPSFAKCYFIKGNHEDVLVRGLEGEPRLLTPWLKFGGQACAQSYGVDIGAIHGQEEHVIEHVLLSAIPAAHINFMKNFYESIRFGDYLFVHAGLRPNVPLEQQSAKDMMGIRKEFLESDADFGCVVVHGHSVSDAVVIKDNRIGIDTGAYATGVLTALRIEDDDRSVIQTSGPADPAFALEDVEANPLFTDNSH
ncbi:MAG: metallophosphoesterase [Pseudomonadota bacterium]